MTTLITVSEEKFYAQAEALEQALARIEEFEQFFRGVLESWIGEPAKGEIHCRYCGERFYVNACGDIDDPDAEHDSDCIVLVASKFLS